MVSVSLPFAKLIPIFDKTQQAFQANSNSLLVSIQLYSKIDLSYNLEFIF